MSNIENTSSIHVNNQIFPWHEKSWNHFVSARQKGLLPHAILLSGEEGIGKLNLAKRLAKSLLCITNTHSANDACNECQACKTYESGANPDYLDISLLEDKQQISVDQIRSLSEFLNYTRSYNTTRVVILHPVERMNLNAANSLLKSLEEPTENTVIILVTANVSNLLATIKSRCQLINVTSPTKDETIHYLNQTNSDIPNTEELLEMVGNKPLKALEISQEDIDNKQQFLSDLQSVIEQKQPINEIAKKWEKYDFSLLLNWQIQQLHQNIKSQYNNSENADKHLEVSMQLLSHLNNDEQWHLYQNLIQQKQYIHTSVNTLMFLENMIMLWLKTK